MSQTLLLVDDDLNILYGLRDTVDWSIIGIDRVLTAHTAMAALRHGEREAISLMITDIRMPGMDGLELLHQMRQLHPCLKAILLSGYPEFSYAQRAIEQGVCRYLLKPVDVEELMEVVSHCIADSQLPEAPYIPQAAEAWKPPERQMADSKSLEARNAKLLLAQEMKEYLNEHFRSDISLKSLARRFHRSPNYISHVFNTVAGEAITVYLNRLRMEEARRLLTETDDTLFSISRATGYHDERYLITQFKKHFGQTPTQYRLRSRDGHRQAARGPNEAPAPPHDPGR